MGVFGCKYCDCDKEKMEDTTEEMKINYNTPIVITANKPTNKNNKGKDDTLSKNNEDFNSLSIQVNSDIDTIQRDNFSNEISTNNFETNNNINNIVKDMINSNNNIYSVNWCAMRVIRACCGFGHREVFSNISMKIDEAILRMEALGHDFFLYLDEDDDRISVVYIRRDGGYGVIQAENTIA